MKSKTKSFLISSIINNLPVSERDGKLLQAIYIGVLALIKDINEVLSIRSLVLNNIETNKTILKQLERSVLLMEFNQEYLVKFLKDGTLTKEDLLAFYQGESIKDKYKIIEKEIENEINSEI